MIASSPSAAVDSSYQSTDTAMYLVKGPVVWRSLHQLTRHTPDLPLWTSLSEYPLKQLTAPKRVIPRVFYLPQSIESVAASAVQTQLQRAA